MPGKAKTAEGGTLPDDISGSLKDLLKTAIEREQNARDFYRRAAEETTDLLGERLLQCLTVIAQGHELMLKKEPDAHLRDAD